MGGCKLRQSCNITSASSFILQSFSLSLFVTTLSSILFSFLFLFLALLSQFSLLLFLFYFSLFYLPIDSCVEVTMPSPCIFELILSLFPLLFCLSVDHFILTCLIQKRGINQRNHQVLKKLNIIMPTNWNLNFISIEYHFLKHFFMFLFLQIALSHPPTLLPGWNSFYLFMINF